MANRHFPDLGLHRAAGQFDRTSTLVAVGVENRNDRQVVEVGVVVGCLLVAVGSQRLLEVALAVERADADEGQAHVARRLAVVAGQDAEAAGNRWAGSRF